MRAVGQLAQTLLVSGPRVRRFGLMLHHLYLKEGGEVVEQPRKQVFPGWVMLHPDVNACQGGLAELRHDRAERRVERAVST
jgi:hypothetical protein